MHLRIHQRIQSKIFGINKIYAIYIFKKLNFAMKNLGNIEKITKNILKQQAIFRFKLLPVFFTTLFKSKFQLFDFFPLKIRLENRLSWISCIVYID
ncbi:hypothetical protein BpHYR1_051712 [Brachionus plicatilis]|uniref:Uncharacterized protein n=1 Tax=Brachionus plicatilis TaxID=10195 RepID=A0A3M7QKY1_BRAPC|nr:hypothetical protein BpHYR1_051712 [Brachionus plicatilis]